MGIQTNEEEKFLMIFFGLKRKTIPSMKKRSREIKELREKFCTNVGDGDSIMDCIEDLKVNGIYNINDVNRRLKEVNNVSDAHPSKSSQDSITVHSPVITAMAVDATPADIQPETKMRKQKGTMYNVYWVLLATLIALIASIGLFKKPTLLPEKCSDVMARRNLPLVLNLESVKSRENLLRSLTIFGEEVSYDWTNGGFGIDSPKRAISMRLQGNDTTILRDFIETFLVTWLGEECTRDQVTFININKTEDVLARIQEVLSRTKETNRDAIALFVLFHGEGQGKYAVKTINSLKDILWEKVITFSHNPPETYPSRGVGFIFLGGDIDTKDCTKCDIVAHDAALGWNNNLLGRVDIRSCLC